MRDFVRNGAEQLDCRALPKIFGIEGDLMRHVDASVCKALGRKKTVGAAAALQGENAAVVRQCARVKCAIEFLKRQLDRTVYLSAGHILWNAHSRGIKSAASGGLLDIDAGVEWMHDAPRRSRCAS